MAHGQRDVVARPVVEADQRHVVELRRCRRGLWRRAGSGLAPSWWSASPGRRRPGGASGHGRRCRADDDRHVRHHDRAGGVRDRAVSGPRARAAGHRQATPAAPPRAPHRLRPAATTLAARPGVCSSHRPPTAVRRWRHGGEHLGPCVHRARVAAHHGRPVRIDPRRHVDRHRHRGHDLGRRARRSSGAATGRAPGPASAGPPATAVSSPMITSASGPSARDSSGDVVHDRLDRGRRRVAVGTEPCPRTRWNSVAPSDHRSLAGVGRPPSNSSGAL